jgi:hypothetical protein
LNGLQQQASDGDNENEKNTEKQVGSLNFKAEGMNTVVVSRSIIRNDITLSGVEDTLAAICLHKG